jgi:hypothetical protein
LEDSESRLLVVGMIKYVILTKLYFALSCLNNCGEGGVRSQTSRPTLLRNGSPEAQLRHTAATSSCSTRVPNASFMP